LPVGGTPDPRFCFIIELKGKEEMGFNGIQGKIAKTITGGEKQSPEGDWRK